MAHLPLATLSSLTEPLILLTRIDSVGGKFAASKEVGKAIVKGVKKDVLTAKIKAIAKIFGYTKSLSAISISIGEKRTAQALFEIKLVVIETKT